MTELLWEKMPVTISLGAWSTFLIYLISIPLGIKKAKQHGLFFDKSTSLLLAVGYAVPAFVFAILLIVFFAGGSYLQWFPLQGFVSDNFHSLNLFEKIADYFLAHGFTFAVHGVGRICKFNLSDKIFIYGRTQ